MAAYIEIATLHHRRALLQPSGWGEARSGNSAEDKDTPVAREIVGYPDFPVTEGNSEPLRCIVTWKQLMFGFMSGVNITDITTQLKQTELGTSNLMECYLHNPVCFLEAVQPDLFKYKKWVVWVGLREYASAIGSWIKPSRSLII
ncbi:hypothetical protein YC2023_036063 [Brassica napus]